MIVISPDWMLNQIRENWEQIYEELKQFYTLKEFIEQKGTEGQTKV